MMANHDRIHARHSSNIEHLCPYTLNADADYPGTSKVNHLTRCK